MRSTLLAGLIVLLLWLTSSPATAGIVAPTGWHSFACGNVVATQAEVVACTEATSGGGGGFTIQETTWHPSIGWNIAVRSANGSVTDNMTAVCGGAAASSEAQGPFCWGVSPGPPAGSSALTVGVVMGTSDAAGNYTPGGPDDAILMGGGTLTYACGEWQCTVRLEDFVGGDSCAYPAAGGQVICNFVPKYTGEPAGSASPGLAASSSGGSNVAETQGGCSAGAVFNPSTGLCVAGQSNGTASTATEAGTAAAPGVASCPTGFSQNQSGGCVGPAQPSAASTALTCPAGYTQNGNVCTSGGTILSTGAPSGTGTLAAGMPTDYNREVTQQQIQQQAAADRTAAEAAAAALPGQLDGLKSAGQDTVAGLGLPTQGQFTAPDVGGIGQSLPASAGDCVALDVALPQLGNLHIAPCAVVSAVRPLIDFLMIALGAIGGIFVLLGRKEEA